MTPRDATDRYARMQCRLEAMADRAFLQHRRSDELATADLENRSRHLADMRGLERSVRLAYAWIVRLDQAAEGRLRPERAEPAARRAEAPAERVEASDLRLAGLPQLPHLDTETETPDADIPAPAGKAPRSAADPTDALLSEFEVGLDDLDLPEPRTQSEILRQALALKRRNGPPPSLRRSG